MRTLLIVLFLVGMSMNREARSEPNVTVWFGTRGTAIYRASLDLSTGKLTDAKAAADIKSPGFLCSNASGSRLYSLGTAEAGANVASYKIEADKTLTLLSTANSGCEKGTHISLSKDERTLLVAHYGSGKVASFPIEEDGSIRPPTSQITHEGSSVNQARQSEPHPHWIGASPDGRFVMVPDLGLDQVVIYELNSEAHTLTPHGVGRVPDGEGPRHLKFHPNGKWAYVINELGLSVTGFEYNETEGTLRPFQTVQAIERAKLKDILNSGSEIRVRPDGKFVYAGIRGHDVIAVFAVNQSTGELSLIEQEPIRGSWPRNFAIDPSGEWLLAAGAESSTVAVFQIDGQTGKLTFTRNIVHVPNSICVEFQPH